MSGANSSASPSSLGHLLNGNASPSLVLSSTPSCTSSPTPEAHFPSTSPSPSTSPKPNDQSASSAFEMNHLESLISGLLGNITQDLEAKKNAALEALTAEKTSPDGMASDEAWLTFIQPHFAEFVDIGGAWCSLWRSPSGTTSPKVLKAKDKAPLYRRLDVLMGAIEEDFGPPNRGHPVTLRGHNLPKMTDDFVAFIGCLSGQIAQLRERIEKNDYSQDETPNLTEQGPSGRGQVTDTPPAVGTKTQRRRERRKEKLGAKKETESGGENLPPRRLTVNQRKNLKRKARKARQKATVQQEQPEATQGAIQPPVTQNAHSGSIETPSSPTTSQSY